MRRPTILLTRPDPECAATARAMTKATGLAVVEAPLITIEPVGPLPDLTETATLIFTSRNGPRAYQTLGGPDLPAICVGEATAQAARDIGLKATALGGDADRLVSALIDTPPQIPLMHLRGEVATGDIAARLTAAGLQTGEAVIYRQHLGDLTDAARDLIADRRPVIVPLYSARTASRLAALARPRAPLHIVSISTAVAKAAAPLKAESRMTAEAPDAPAMIRAVLATLRRVEGTDGAH